MVRHGHAESAARTRAASSKYRVREVCLPARRHGGEDGEEGEGTGWVHWGFPGFGGRFFLSLLYRVEISEISSLSAEGGSPPLLATLTGRAAGRDFVVESAAVDQSSGFRDHQTKTWM